MSREVSIGTGNLLRREVSGFDEFADHCLALLDQARDADVAVLPELVTMELFTCLPGWRDRTLDDLGEISQFTDQYRALFTCEAKARKQWLLAGSHLIREGSRLLNVAHLFRPEGQVITHAKTHLFPIEHTLGFGEGDEMAVIQLPFGRIAITICYEAEIPECSLVATRRGAEPILCPSFTSTEHGLWRVRHCLQARAIENQIFLVHSRLTGNPEGPLRGGWGQGSIVSPCDRPWPANGVVAQVEANAERMTVATVDLGELYGNRENGPATTRLRWAGLYPRWDADASGDTPVDSPGG